MWTTIKSLFSSKGPKFDQPLPSDFDKQVKRAIVLVRNTNTVKTDEEFLNYLIENGIEFKAAVEILLFLPIAFVRHLIATLKWPDTYLELINADKKIERRYSETKSYQIIWNVTSEYFNDNPDKDTVFKIAGRSAEFNALNNLLNENPDSKLEDVEVSSTVIVR
ncbi:hypothetical protein [Foetidibacter luteolus]|uniref:hypothetical protein n=1 Tax=Foetidibacter luteolus TaxID=2608880 RepID=UPI00129A3145|nr:hypothetical protein [Foetidibacter luteolus]